MKRTYSELLACATFASRYEYLKLGGSVGEITFGFERYLNQSFYRSVEWRRVRDQVIVRDNACDLAFPGQNLRGRIIVHHMNPVTIEDFERDPSLLLDPEYLVTVSNDTHLAIHYGRSNFGLLQVQERRPGDTCPWRI